MWNYAFSWPTILIISPLLVAIGFGALSMSPAEVKVANWLFTIGYSIAVVKIVAWIAFERPEPIAECTLFVVTCPPETSPLEM